VAEPLSAADRSALQAERGPVNMAVAGLLVFEPGPGTSYDAVAERLEGRLHLVPRYRQRLEEPPLGLANPVWVDDASFDLHWHLRRATVGSEAEVRDYVAREMSRRLDRSRPLWELHLVDGLPDRRAMLVKMHHSLVDGLAAIGVGLLLLDPTPEPLAIDPPGADWEPRPYELSRHVTALARVPLARATRLVTDTLDLSPRRAAQDLARATDLVTELARTRPQAPMTPLNHPIGPNRRYATASAPLADVRAAGRRADGTVNDAVLAVVAGMLRDYLPELPDRPPVALVPVSLRREGDERSGDEAAGRGRTGNRISTVFVDLPVDEHDPAERIRRIAASMRELKGSAAVRAGALLVGATGQAPPFVSAALVRAIGNVRAFNLVVSNVPGPQQPFYMGGSRLLEVYPAVPLNPANQGLSVGILSYDGSVFFGLLADAGLEPGIEAAEAALRNALAEVA
jgi:diacylglycerol O-acyltransferase